MLIKFNDELLDFEKVADKSAKEKSRRSSLEDSPRSIREYGRSTRIGTRRLSRSYPREETMPGKTTREVEPGR